MEKELLRPVKISKAKSSKKDGNNIGAKLYFSKKFSDLLQSIPQPSLVPKWCIPSEDSL